MTKNEKKRVTDFDVFSQSVDFLLEAVEIQETMKGQMTKTIQNDEENKVFEKPQLKFKDKINNFMTEYSPICLKKYHSTYPTNTQPHPYVNEMKELKLMPWQIEK